MILCLETATNLCSVALCDSAGVVSLRESNDHRSHSSMLTVFIEQIFNENHLKASDLDAVAVSKGPGSYTGLRIGVSVAKGIAYAASIPLIGIETTYSMFRGIYTSRTESRENSKNMLYCPMLDARRMEVYYAIYDTMGNSVKNICAETITDDSFNSIPESLMIVFFGDGAAKCKDIIKRKKVHFADDFIISASYMQQPVFEALRNRHFEDVAYFEPFYLKDFITSIPRKSIPGINMAQ